jgi:hypothetical protein
MFGGEGEQVVLVEMNSDRRYLVCVGRQSHLHRRFPGTAAR